MKTTLDIEPDLYSAVEQIARSQHKSRAQVVSELLRRAFESAAAPHDPTELARRNGFEVFPERPGAKATVEGVAQLCREEGI